MSDDLAAWLTQIWDEREKAALAALQHEDGDEGPFLRHAADYLGSELADHIAANDPASVLARIAADRQILDDLAQYCWKNPFPNSVSPGQPCGECDRIGCRNLRRMASAYADRPGYREEWKP